MRFLQVGDLHIGKRLNEVSLLEDQQYILRQILDIAAAETVDALLDACGVAASVRGEKLEPAVYLELGKALVALRADGALPNAS